MIWFVSDTHFGHKNSIERMGRPFSSVEEMDEAMVENWNRVVSANDTVYHLGDFSWYGVDENERLLARLHGRKHLIEGNHDGKRVLKARGWTTVNPSYLELRHAPSEFSGLVVLCHYAMRVWNKSHYGSVHLFGHSHGTLKDANPPRSKEVCVECVGYTPVSMDHLVAEFATAPFDEPTPKWDKTESA